MNFLLHGHLALRDTGSPVAAVGAMLPDLWRTAHRRARHQRLPDGVDAPRLRAGFVHHAEADRTFHKSEAMKGGEGALLEALRVEKLHTPRLALFAHPLWEMCLDGALVRQRGAEALRGWLERSLREAQGELVPCEAALVRALGDDGGPFAERMARIYRELLTGPWLDAYTRGEGVAYCLDGIRLSLGMQRILAGEREPLARLLDDLAPRADQALQELLQ